MSAALALEPMRRQMNSFKGLMKARWWSSSLYLWRGRPPPWPSVFYLTNVPLCFRFLPPVGHEGLLVVSHPLELGVGVVWLGAGRFFWAHHVLKTNQNTESGTAVASTVLLRQTSTFSFCLAHVDNLWFSLASPAAALRWAGPSRGRHLPVTFHTLPTENSVAFIPQRQKQGSLLDPFMFALPHALIITGLLEVKI